MGFFFLRLCLAKAKEESTKPKGKGAKFVANIRMQRPEENVQNAGYLFKEAFLY